MTVARDIKTGAVVGQVTTVRKDGNDTHYPGHVLVLSRDGYKVLPRSSVRLEKVR